MFNPEIAKRRKSRRYERRARIFKKIENGIRRRLEICSRFASDDFVWDLRRRKNFYFIQLKIKTSDIYEMRLVDGVYDVKMKEGKILGSTVALYLPEIKNSGVDVIDLEIKRALEKLKTLKLGEDNEH